MWFCVLLVGANLSFYNSFTVKKLQMCFKSAPLSHFLGNKTNETKDKERKVTKRLQ